MCDFVIDEMDICAELRFESKTSSHRKKLFAVQVYAHVCYFCDLLIHLKSCLLHDSLGKASEGKNAT